MNDLIPALREFVSFFTVKRVVTLLIVVLALLVVCAPQHETTTEDGGACDSACPLPGQPPVINVPPVVITSVSRDNWSFDLVDDGWVPDEPSNPETKVIFFNESEGYMVLLIKEKTDLSLGAYVIESIEGFSIGGGRIHTIKQVKLNQQKFVLLEGSVHDDGFLSWNTTKDGFGYSFCCFYSSDVDAGTKKQDMCQTIAESLQIE